ncbi:uncharacterized protein [Excalfactoria chinensis]|uniref:uncharacterized protein n=1 Tax=Excalfactoria chinensis TaxID=46218 RepID=UPI003B3AA810
MRAAFWAMFWAVVKLLISAALYVGLQVLMFLWSRLQSIVMWGLVVQSFYLWKPVIGIPDWLPFSLTNITDTVLGLAYECSEFLKYDWGVKWDMVLLVSLIITNIVSSYKTQRDWQTVVRDLGKRLEASGPPVSGNLTPEHQRDLEKGCSSGGSQNERIMMEIESLKNEIQTLKENLQVNPSKPQEAPASVSVAPVEGQRWERGSSRLERKEEVEEDPGEGPSPKPPKKATQKTNRHGEDSDDEGEVTISSTRKPMKITEIQGMRKEFTRVPGESVVTWLLRCWDSGAGSVSLSCNEARQLGNISRNPSVDRGISRCLDGVATLWDRILSAVKTTFLLRSDLEPVLKKWNTAEEGIQCLREMAVAEMLYDPMFVPEDPHDGHDPEKVSTTPEIWKKLIRSAPDRYASVLLAAANRYEEMDRRPQIFELILALQNTESTLAPTRASIAAICQVGNRLDQVERILDGLLKNWSAARNNSEPVAVSAIRRKRPPARVNDRSEPMSRGALWNYLREHGEDMRKWHDEPTYALRARVKELQKRSANTEIASAAAGNQ